MSDSMETENGFTASNPLVQEFHKSRTALIEQENEHRSDHEFRTTLSLTAKRAEEIVSRIRLHEHSTIWSSSSSSPNKTGEETEELFPGMIFNSAKAHLKNTDLWRIVQRMPKGAILHCHFGAMVDLNWVFDLAIKTPGMCISSSSPLSTKTALEEQVFVIKFCKTLAVGAASIWSPSYVPGTQISLPEAASTFPSVENINSPTSSSDPKKTGTTQTSSNSATTGTPAFISWLISRCTITQSDAISHHLGVDDIWKKLQGAFMLLGPIVFYEPITRVFLREILRSAMRDGVKWVEMRGMTRGFRLEGHEEPTDDQMHLVRLFNEVFTTFMAEESNNGKDFWGARLIWAFFRIAPDEEIIKDMKVCIRAKALYPNLISGYDLVGPEDSGRPLTSLLPPLLWFRETCTRTLPPSQQIPFFLHAGECLGHGDTTDQNMYDAILLGSRRIGHAFSLYKHPLLTEMVKERNILVESCPISNEVLRYSASVLSHPLPALLARGVKACLSNDDPALMGQGDSGMSCDFWQAVQSWENLGLAGLGALAQNSVRWAAFDDQTDEEWDKDIATALTGSSLRARRVQEWNAEWEVFCQWVVDEFGESS